MSRPAILVSLLLLVLSVPALGQFSEYGFVAGSSSDSGCFFTRDLLDGWAFGPVIDLLPGGNYPYDAVMRPRKDEVWVVGAVGDAVLVLEPGYNGIVATIPVGEYPVSLAFNVRDNIALVSCRDSERLDIIDLESMTVTGSLDIPGDPGQIIYDLDEHRFFLAEWYGDMIFEIDRYGTQIVNQASVGSGLWQVAIDPYNIYTHETTLYVTDRGTDQLLVLDTETLTVTASHPVGDDPWGLDCKAGAVAVCCEDSKELFYMGPFVAPGDTLKAVALPEDCDPRDLNISMDIIINKDKWLDYGAIYIAGGQTAEGSPVYVFNIYDEIISHTILPPVTNANVVAVDPQWAMPSGVNDEIPGRTLIARVAPNPFNPVTEVSFDLPLAGTTEVLVHDIAGRLVRTLWRGALDAGPQSLTWNGCDDDGRSLPSGTYLVCVKAGSLLSTVKAVLVE